MFTCRLRLSHGLLGCHAVQFSCAFKWVHGPISICQCVLELEKRARFRQANTNPAAPVQQISRQRHWVSRLGLPDSPSKKHSWDQKTQMLRVSNSKSVSYHPTTTWCDWGKLFTKKKSVSAELPENPRGHLRNLSLASACHAQNRPSIPGKVNVTAMEAWANVTSNCDSSLGSSWDLLRPMRSAVGTCSHQGQPHHNYRQKNQLALIFTVVIFWQPK